MHKQIIITTLPNIKYPEFYGFFFPSRVQQFSNQPNRGLQPMSKVQHVPTFDNKGLPVFHPMSLRA